MSAAAFASANCQLPELRPSFASSHQFSPVCHVFRRVCSLFLFLFFWWGISPLCAFSANQTNFAHFGMPRMQMPFLSPNYTIHHISFDSTSRESSQTVKESKRVSLSPTLPLVPHPHSAPFRTANVFPIPTPWPNWQSEFLMGFCDESSHVSHVASPTVIEVNFIARGKQFNFLQSIGKT